MFCYIQTKLAGFIIGLIVSLQSQTKSSYSNTALIQNYRKTANLTQNRRKLRNVIFIVLTEKHRINIQVHKHPLE